MATYIYKIENVTTIDGIDIEIHPLKIKYMREFMDIFNTITADMSEEQTIDILCDCARVAMKQYFPAFSTNVDDILDNFDLKTVYEILDYSVGIKINQSLDDSINDQSNKSESGNSWDDLDLAKLESEAFLLGIWKDYDELERSLSIPELMSTISSSRELDYQEKKFLAAIQGVDLEENSESGKGQQEWENMKARVFSGGAAKDSRDILSLQGQNAIAAGFGIGMGLEYENLT